jgi:serine/threonine protein kinase
MLEIYEKGEAWLPVDDDFEFSHNSLVIKNPSNGELFYAQTKQRYKPHEKPNPDELELIPVPLDDVWPLAMLYNLVEAPSPIPSNCYVKRPSLLGYEEFRHRYRLSDMLIHEAKVCQSLSESPHPNIAEYYGTVVENERIVGLCFRKYSVNLAERMQDRSRPLDKKRCIDGIRSGTQHMHILGFIHNDINPYNVMFDRDDIPVIIDFDSCQNEGDELGLKAGTPGWSDVNSKVSVAATSFHGLRKIEDLLGSVM